MNDDARIQVVRQFEKLNLEYDKELQHTILLAAKLCKTPISFISLINKDVEVLKVKNDLNFNLTAAELSFCFQNVSHNGVLVINDTLNDERFSSQPCVTGNLKIRFYVSAPLITQHNLLIGMLCVMDDKPHNFNNHDKLVFKILAKHVISVMELKLSLEQLDTSFYELEQERKTRLENEVKLRSMFESLTDAYFLLGINGEVLDFNRAAFDFVKYKLGLKLKYGQILADILPATYNESFKLNMQNALIGKRKHWERLADYGAKGVVWLDCVFEPVKNANDKIIGASYVTRDITERKLNEEKIKKQNYLLTKIAEIQSHEYRGPVSSILGLMSLIEKNDYKASKDYLIMMQGAVEKLDEKIHEVVNMVNNL